jgi:putative tricarboxylic transport membrane protein
MKIRHRELLISMIWLAISIAICIGSVRLDLGRLSVPGPGFFSFLCGAVMGIMALVIFVQAIRSQSDDLAKPIISNPRGFLKMTYGFIALVLYAVVMEYIGFALSTVLFMGFFLRVVVAQKWRVVFACSIIPTICAYLIFKSWLDVQLPGGFLGY